MTKIKNGKDHVTQFLKYGICGIVATATDVVIFFFLAWKVFPALGADDRLVSLLNIALEPITEAMRSRNYLINRCLCFFVSNLVAYTGNVIWVFETGKHAKHKEIMLFYLVSGLSFVVGTSVGWGLIVVLGMSTSVAYIVNGLVAVAINYALRKFYIFKG